MLRFLVLSDPGPQSVYAGPRPLPLPLLTPSRTVGQHHYITAGIQRM